MIIDDVGPVQSSMSVEAVRAAQAHAQSVSLAGSDKSSGLPQPQVKRQAAGDVRPDIAPRSLTAEFSEQIVHAASSGPSGHSDGIAIPLIGVAPESAAMQQRDTIHSSPNLDWSNLQGGAKSDAMLQTI